MQLRKIVRVYREGWMLIARALVFAMASYAVMLPLKLLEAFEGMIPDWLEICVAILIFLVYLPFAAHIAYQLVKDLNKTDHEFTPLLDRIRGKRSKTVTEKSNKTER